MANVSFSSCVQNVMFFNIHTYEHNTTVLFQNRMDTKSMAVVATYVKYACGPKHIARVGKDCDVYRVCVKKTYYNKQ